MAALPLKLRYAVLQRDHFTCQYCGRSAPEVPLEVDHRWPESRGGPGTMANLVTACRDCNQGKSASVPIGVRLEPTAESLNAEWARVEAYVLDDFRECAFILRGGLEQYIGRAATQAEYLALADLIANFGELLVKDALRIIATTNGYTWDGWEHECDGAERDHGCPEPNWHSALPLDQVRRWLVRNRREFHIIRSRG